MSDEDLKLVITTYQQKAFELFNQNIVLETQINQLNKKIEDLSSELTKLKNKKVAKTEEDY
jgi:dynactin complex subunit